MWGEGMTGPMAYRGKVSRDVVRPERFGWKPPKTLRDFKVFAQAFADEFEAGTTTTRCRPMPDRPVRTPEVVPGLDYSTHDGFRIDGSVVQWWGTKSAAREGAKRIGWPMNLSGRFTPGSSGLGAAPTHGGFLTRAPTPN